MSGKILFVLVSVFLSASVAQATMVNIVNGDFEDTTVMYPNAAGPVGWTVNHGGIGVFGAPAGHSSAYACLFNATAMNSQVLFQEVPHVIKSGYTYTYSVDFNCGVGLTQPTAWDSLSIQLWSDTGTAKEQMIIIPVTPGDFTAANQWKTFSDSITADSTIAGRTMFVQFQLIGGIQPFLDNVTIEEVPEPMTLSLLALGGLMSLRRHRS